MSSAPSGAATTDASTGGGGGGITGVCVSDGAPPTAPTTRRGGFPASITFVCDCNADGSASPPVSMRDESDAAASARVST